MAEAATMPSTPDEAARASGLARLASRKLLLALAAMLTVAAIGVAAANWFGVLEFGIGAAPEAVQAPAAEPVYFELPEFVVNVDTGGRRSSFLKLRVRLQLDSADAIPRIEARLPRIIDHFQVYLRELRREDLDGAVGTYRMREELLKRVRLDVAPTPVADLLFVEILMQ
ncbi:MAG: flagellar basal body protein FliL [Rhodospirillales bacterium]|nr:MAG: flagellar basal body protein FliL [Rhodospirillales bacterium]